MKRKCALLVSIALFLAAIGFVPAAVASEAALYLDATKLQYLADMEHVVRVTAKAIVENDLPFTFEYDGQLYSGVIPAGEKEAFVPITIKSTEAFSKTMLALNKGEGYRVSTSRGKAEVIIIPDPVIVLGQGGLSVAAAGTNVRISFEMENHKDLSYQLVLELRDEEGNVLDAQPFSKEKKETSFKFRVPDDWTGSNYVALWFGDKKVSEDYTIEIRRDISAVYSVDTDRRAVAISVDCGSGNEKSTRAWLDLMDEYNVKATYFVTGRFAENNREILKEILDRGHEIGNHSWSHAAMGGMEYDEILNEIIPTNQVIFEATDGYVPKFFRAPGGKWSYSLHTVLQTLDLTVIQWSFDSKDSFDDITAQRIYWNVTGKNVHPGAIYLFHNATPCFDIMDDVFEYYKQNGYEMVSISDLLPDGDYIIDKDGVVHAVE